MYDISVVINSDIVTWPGDPAVSITREASIEKGDVCNVSRLAMGVHTGTHIDAPFHFIDQGKSIDQISLETCFGPCVVIEVQEPVITRASMEGRIASGVTRVLFKTSNSELWSSGAKAFFKEFVALSGDCAEYLVEYGIELVGVDYLSVESFYADEGNPVHNTLLSNGVVLLEGCDLSQVSPGDYTLAAFPLRLEGVDGSPCRAVLFDR